MSKIFELYGYPVDSWDDDAWKNLRNAHCPFMNAKCDGGGNRFSSEVSLNHVHILKDFFLPQLSCIQAGVCSLQLHDNEQPWIVCPRRLLNFRSNERNFQTAIKKRLLSYANLQPGKKYNVWSEVKLKCVVQKDNKSDLFDYTFDYVIASCCRKKLSFISELLHKTEKATRRILESNGALLEEENGTCWYNDFPVGPPIIIEVMTSSTSGGNDKNRTQISQVFEDTIYQLANKKVVPEGPGINYRQVWARMVSQLLVKSQIGLAWGGRTFWIIQDLLATYISKTTALNLNHFFSHQPSEVNLLSGSYNSMVQPGARHNRIIDIPDVCLFAGPVSRKQNHEEDFSDIVKLGCTPSVEELWRILVGKKPCASFVYESDTTDNQ